MRKYKKYYNNIYSGLNSAGSLMDIGVNSNLPYSSLLNYQLTPLLNYQSTAWDNNSFKIKPDTLANINNFNYSNSFPQERQPLKNTNENYNFDYLTNSLKLSNKKLTSNDITTGANGLIGTNALHGEVVKDANGEGTTTDTSKSKFNMNSMNNDKAGLIVSGISNGVAGFAGGTKARTKDSSDLRGDINAMMGARYLAGNANDLYNQSKQYGKIGNVGSLELSKSARLANGAKTLGTTTLAGASIGSAIMPGIGTAIGAGVGAIAGGVANVIGHFRGKSKARRQKRELERKKMIAETLNRNRYNDALRSNEQENMLNAQLNYGNRNTAAGYAAFGGSLNNLSNDMPFNYNFKKKN